MNKNFSDIVMLGIVKRRFPISEPGQKESYRFQFIRVLPMRSEVSLLIKEFISTPWWVSYENCYIQCSYYFCHSCKYYSDNEILNCAVQPVLADLISQSKVYECPDFEVK